VNDNIPPKAEGRISLPHWIKLNVLKSELRTNPTDHRTVRKGDDTITGIDEGIMGYLPREDIGGLFPIHRLYRPNASDHFDSDHPAEGGYQSEAVLGYAWQSDMLGNLRPLFRYYSADNDDHVTRFASQPVPEGYERDYPWNGAYGMNQNPSPDLECISNSGVDACFDMAWGGSGYTLYWRDRQFLDSHDNGRLLQFAFLRPGRMDADRSYRGW